jgi:hypothetical protein
LSGLADYRRQLMIGGVLNIEVTGMILRGHLQAKEVTRLIGVQFSIPQRYIFGIRRRNDATARC